MAGVGLCVAANLVVDVLAVQRGGDTTAFLAALMLAGVRCLVLALGGKYTVTVTVFIVNMDTGCLLGIALRSVFMLAGCALGGGTVSAFFRMLWMMGAQSHVL